MESISPGDEPYGCSRNLSVPSKPAVLGPSAPEVRERTAARCTHCGESPKALHPEPSPAMEFLSRWASWSECSRYHGLFGQERRHKPQERMTPDTRRFLAPTPHQIVPRSFRYLPVNSTFAPRNVPCLAIELFQPPVRKMSPRSIRSANPHPVPRICA